MAEAASELDARNRKNRCWLQFQFVYIYVCTYCYSLIFGLSGIPYLETIYAPWYPQYLGLVKWFVEILC